MRIATLIQHSAELIRIVYNSPQPTDKILSEFFRSKKQYGSKERRFVVNTIYFVLRNYILFSWLSEKINSTISKEISNDEWKIIIGLFLSNQYPIISESYFPDELISKVESNEDTNSILHGIFEDKYDELKNIISREFQIIDTEIDKISDLNLTCEQLKLLEIRFSLPLLLLEKILPTFSTKDELITFLHKSAQQAPLSLRINELKTNLSEVKRKFNELEINTTESEILPNCIFTNNRIQLSEFELYKNGNIEVQDEGSQLISLILNSQPNELILDACAGAGGKSIHIATLQKNTGLIIANDIEYQRLKEIPKRANRVGISSIITHLSRHGKDNFREIMELSKGRLFDKVLIDAPCSGSGTIRRDPLKKYRINQKLIEKISQNQTLILQEYSRYVRPGGILLYSTCSVLLEENGKIADDFLKNNPKFQAVNIVEEISEKINFQKLRINNNEVSVDFRNTQSDGFFMAKMMRIE